MSKCILFLLAVALGPILLARGAYAETDERDPRTFVQLVEDFSGTCSGRNAKQVLVKSAHPSRVIRVWLDRYVMNVGTGDRSRSDLAPGGEPEPLGCSRSLEGATQEWRIVRAAFTDSLPAK
jgi:hypothetical protein